MKVSEEYIQNVKDINTLKRDYVILICKFLEDNGWTCSEDGYHV